MGSSTGVKEVAGEAGVSVGTVSNVLNRPDLVADATRHRVLQAIAELGFVRNECGRQLAPVRVAPSPISSSTRRTRSSRMSPRASRRSPGRNGLAPYICNSDSDAHTRGRLPRSAPAAAGARGVRSPRSVRTRRPRGALAPRSAGGAGRPCPGREPGAASGSTTSRVAAAPSPTSASRDTSASPSWAGR